MATAGDGAAPYQSGGAGGKLRKRPVRRSAQATPYDRPPTALRNNSPSLFAKLVDPASRLIYAGADRLFGVFRNRLPSLPAPRPSETSEVPRNGLQEAGPNTHVEVSEPSNEGGNLARISAASEISELENMLKQKTFTRSEIERLTALLHSKTNEPALDDVNEDRAKLPSTASHLMRLDASTSNPLCKQVEEKENLHVAISTPVVKSRALEEDAASPADIAKAYMGTRPAKVSQSTLRLGSQAPRQNSMLLNNTTILPRTPITSLAPRTAGSFKGFENGLTTPRSRGRSAMYNMARTPYYRGTSTLSQKGIKSDYGHHMVSPSLTSSQLAGKHDGPSESSKMALKRRSSVLDDIGSGSPVRRIRKKANLLSQSSSLLKHRSEFGSNALEQPNTASQKLLLRNEPEPKVSKAVEENGETSRRNLGYASIPTKSIQTASKILEQLERLSPKEKSSGSRLAGLSEKSPTKPISLGSGEKVDAPKFVPSPQSNQKSEGLQHAWLPDARESTSQSKGEVDENGPRKFAVPRNVMSSMNGISTVSVRDNAPIVTNTDYTLKLPAEPPQKKRAFQMSAQEDSLELDGDSRSNGYVSIPSGENKNLGTSVVVKKNAPAEVCKNSPPKVGKISAMPEFKNIDDAISPPKTGSGPSGGSVTKEQKTVFKFSTSPPSGSNTRSAMLSQSTSVGDAVAPQKEPTVSFPKFGASTKNAEKVPPLMFSANEPSGTKPNADPDARPLGSTSMFSSVTNNYQVRFSASTKDNNDNAQKSAPASGIFSFGGSTKNSDITNGASASSPSIFGFSSPSTASGTLSDKGFSASSSHALSSSTTAAFQSSTTTTSESSVVFSTSAPAPIFSYGSASASSTSVLVAPVSAAEAPENSATKAKEPKSNNISSSPFGSTSFATASGASNIFGFSSPVTTSTTSKHSQGTLFNGASGSQTSTAATHVVPFQFGSSSNSLVSGAPTFPSSTSGSSPFGSSAPALSLAPSFGLSSAIASSDIKSGSSTSSPTTNIFGSAFSSAPSFGLSSNVALSETKSGSSASASTTSMFGSAWQSPKSSAFGSTLGSPSTAFSFGASSTSMSSASSSPIVFGSSNAGASTGSSMFSFTATGATTSTFPVPSTGQSSFGASMPVFGAPTTNAGPTNSDFPGQSSFGASMPVFGAATTSPNNNDQMSMEDIMAEDSTQTPSPSISPFGQAPAATPGFMFGSATPPPPASPFQFGGQTNQPPPQNPFQASGSVEFNAGGSFSLGSGGTDKSNRRILRVKSKNRKK